MIIQAIASTFTWEALGHIYFQHTLLQHSVSKKKFTYQKLGSGFLLIKLSIFLEPKGVYL